MYKNIVGIKLNPASLGRVITKLRTINYRVDVMSEQGLDQVANEVFDLAQERVPVMTGALQSSGKVTSHSTGYIKRRKISYGDSTLGARKQPTSAYAVPLHEMPSSPGYKWLENSLIDKSEDFLRTLAETLKFL